MQRVSVVVDGMDVDFALGQKVAASFAEKDSDGPMLLCWNDKAREMHSPSGVNCEIKGEPGWEVYGRNHGGRLRISINNDALVFIYS